MATISLINRLKKYISTRIPDSQTNILFMIVNGVGAAIRDIEYKLNIRKRENNILTANFDSSLRSLVAMNGFEPSLRIPSSGVVHMFVSPKLFGRVGYPLYLPPYAVFVCETTGIEYYYNSPNVLKIDGNNFDIPLVEGAVRTLSQTSTGKYLERVYIETPDVADKSFRVDVGGVEYLEVKSFFDNDGINDNKQFVVKFSENPNKPIVIYVKGSEMNDVINVSYRISLGEAGNLNFTTTFQTQDIMDLNGNEIAVDSSEVSIQNTQGFKLGSNGTLKDTMRAAIGYNHGQNMLYDSTTYTNFINKYSVLMLQKIKFAENNKAINYIYVSRRQYYNTQLNDVPYLYKKIVDNKKYLVSKEDKEKLDESINYYSFCMSSHVLFDPEICKFALQIMFETHEDEIEFSKELSNQLYKEFIEFFYVRDKVFNVDTFFANFMEKYNVRMTYMLFNELDEKWKLENKSSKQTDYIISHNDYLPILKGDFNICDKDYNPVQLFFDLNITCEETL